MPKPLYTEATLLAAMETCGRNITDEKAKEAMKELGIGTPATRAAIITTLFKRDYIERSGKALVPTEKGLYIYEAVKDMQVANVELTGSWEKTLLQIEQHTLETRSFMHSIEFYLAGNTRGTRTEIPCTQTAYPPLPQMRYRQSDDTPEGRQVRQSGLRSACIPQGTEQGA